MGMWQHRLEEAFLGILIVLNIFDFTNQLPGDVNFLKKIISWTLIAYLFYKVSLTTIFLGEQNRVLDATLVISYSFFIVKNLVFVAPQAAQASSFFSGILGLIAQQGESLTLISLIIGGVLLLVHAIVLADWSYRIAPAERSFATTLKRAFLLFAGLFSFFVIVFNFFMEWIATAVDAPLLVITLLFYFFTLYQRQWMYFNADSFLYKVGEAGDQFYKQFAHLFANRRTLMLGLSGMLVLHLIVDGGVYLLPYLTGLENTLYFKSLGPGHQSMISHFFADAAYVNGIPHWLMLAWIYALNAAFLGFALIIPAYLWWSSYRNRHPDIPLSIIGLFVACLAAFVLTPVFSISPVRTDAVVNKGLVGVDIQTQGLFGGSIPLLKSSFFTSLFFFVAGFALSSYIPAKKRILKLSLWVFDVFIAVYVYIFLRTMLIYAFHPSQGAILSLYSSGQYFVMAYVSLFVAVMAGFYIISFLSYLLIAGRWLKEEEEAMAPEPIPL